MRQGLRCDAATAESGTSMTSCPPGQFVTGTTTDGSFQCASPAVAFQTYVTDNCEVVFGWRDECNGCTDPPSKWGRVKVGSCALGIGADDTCGKYTLGGTSVDMFGVNPDGNVDGNDTFYVGLRCN